MSKLGFNKLLDTPSCYLTLSIPRIPTLPMKRFFKITNFTTVGNLNTSTNRIQKIAPDIDYKLLKKKKIKNEVNPSPQKVIY